MGEELTQNEYNALSNSEKFSGKLFFIIDQGYIYKNDVIYGGTSNSGKIFKNGVQYGRNSHARIYKNGIEYAVGIIVVEVPTVAVGTYTYNGSAQGPTITGLDTEHCTVTNATKTLPGTYTMTISLNDTNGCVWSDGTTTPKTYEYTIKKVSVALPVFSNMSYVYDGAAHSPTVTYNSTYCNISGNGSLTNVGSQTVTVSLKDTSLAMWTDGTTANKTSTFSITKRSIALPTFSNMTYTYDGNAHSPTVSYNSTYCNISGNGSRTNAGSQTVTVSLKSTTNTQWSDGTIAAKSATFTINKADFVIKFKDNTVTITNWGSNTGYSKIMSSGGQYLKKMSTYPSGTFSISRFTDPIDDNIGISRIDAEIPLRSGSIYTTNISYRYKSGGTDIDNISFVSDNRQFYLENESQIPPNGSYGNTGVTFTIYPANSNYKPAVISGTPSRMQIRISNPS